MFGYNNASQLNFAYSHNLRANCIDANQFVFWDFLHPTTAAHEVIAKLVSEFIKKKLLLQD